MSNKIILTGFLTLFMVAGCSSVSEKIPTVKIERKKPSVQTAQIQSSPSYVTQASYAAPKVQKAEAAMVCDNENMRTRSKDNDPDNDSARVLILEEGGSSSNILADVEINCRDYFETTHSRHVFATPYYQPTSYRTPEGGLIVPAQHLEPAVQYVEPVVTPAVVPQIKPPATKSYAIKSGDNLYRIAKNNCTTIEEISDLNDILDPAEIDVNQIIILPNNNC